MDEFIDEAHRKLRSALAGLDFDQATFFEHAIDDDQGHHQRLACPRFVIERSGPGRAWAQRWQPEAASGVEWLLSPTPWTDDLEEIVEDEFEDSGTKVGELDAVRELRDGRIRSLLGRGIFSEGRVLASVLLGSMKPFAYGADERDRLNTDAIAAVMEELLEDLQMRRLALVERFRRYNFRLERPAEKIAQDLADMLAEANDWDFVGIYRVEDEFAMVASRDRTPDQKLHIDAAYRQPLDVGMLGETLRLRTCLRADNVRTDPPPYNYSKIEGFEAYSALCYPIIVLGEVAWILDCASTARAAFHGPDRMIIDQLVQELQSTLELWFETRLANAIIDGLSEPVLVADRKGNLTRVNRAASELFNPKELPSPLADLAFDDVTRLKLLDPSSLLNDHLRFKNASGQPIQLLASANLSNAAFGQFVVKLTSKSEQHWLAGLAVARQTVEDDIGQARVPLMLAAALICRARIDLQQQRDPNAIDERLRRAAEAIEEADLSYDKIVGALAGERRSESKQLVLDTLVEWAVASSRSSAGDSRVENAIESALKTVAEHFVRAGDTAGASAIIVSPAQTNRTAA